MPAIVDVAARSTKARRITTVCQPWPSNVGVVYTDYVRMTQASPHVTALWSYDSRERTRGQRLVAIADDGCCEYWLERSDPLLNTILPSTAVSVVANCGDSWHVGQTARPARVVPRLTVIGPLTRPQTLFVGRRVAAVAVAVLPMLVRDIFGVPPATLLDQMVPLDEIWSRRAVERLWAALSTADLRRRVGVLRDSVTAGIAPDAHRISHIDLALQDIRRSNGTVSIRSLTEIYGCSRQAFARRFAASTGLPPKLFARITRFHALVRVLLATDVRDWATVGPAAGFYDQAHMINEFRAFAGTSPTEFFQPRGVSPKPAMSLRGRPREWGHPPDTRETR